MREKYLTPDARDYPRAFHDLPHVLGCAEDLPSCQETALLDVHERQITLALFCYLFY